MAIYFKSGEFEGSMLAIWKTEESKDELCRQLNLSPSLLPARAESRQKEWLAIRILIKNLLDSDGLPAIEYDSNGKPALPGSDYSISISHSKEYVGVVLSKLPACGMDLEIIHPRIKKIAGRFLSQRESLFMQEPETLSTLYVVWGAKEVLYKLHGKGDLLFKEHLSVDPFTFHSPGNVSAHIRKENYAATHTIHYRQLGELMLTVALD